MTDKKDKPTVQMPLRFRLELVEAIAKAVEGSPIEFQNNQDFVRHAVMEELKRRGLIKTYK